MFKRGIGHYVVLVMCVLGLVLQPLLIYADIIYDAETLGRSIKPFSSILDEDVTLSDTVFDIASYYSLSLYDLSASNVVCFRSPNNGVYLYFMPSTYNVTMNVPTPNNSASYAFYDGISSDRLSVNYYYYLNGSFGSGSGTSTSFSTIGTILFISDDMTTNDGRSIFISVSSGSDSGDSSSSTTGFIYDLLFFFFKQNALPFKDVINADDENDLFTPIGYWLDYDFKCKFLYNNPTVPIIDTDGNAVMHANYLYPLYNSLSSIAAAFPDREAVINDAIADSVLDDSSGSGLTVSKISVAKSDLDDSLSKFSVTIGSDAEYSGVGSALDGQDWSFWSQQTFDNCYMFTFDPFEAQLMDDVDVATQEDSLFKQLVGWD